MADTPRQSEAGRAFFGSKDLRYLQKLSRESVEKHTNTSVLYFQIDVEKSKRNFYGELLVKKFVNPQGIEIKGVIDIESGSSNNVEGIPNFLASLKFSCYNQHLEELGADPQLGEYFAIRDRVYQIYDRVLPDANKVTIAIEQANLVIEYMCIELDSEQLTPEAFGESFFGSKSQIESQKGKPV